MFFVFFFGDLLPFSSKSVVNHHNCKISLYLFQGSNTQIWANKHPVDGRKGYCSYGYLENIPILFVGFHSQQVVQVLIFLPWTAAIELGRIFQLYFLLEKVHIQPVILVYWLIYHLIHTHPYIQQQVIYTHGLSITWLEHIGTYL